MSAFKTDTNEESSLQTLLNESYPTKNYMHTTANLRLREGCPLGRYLHYVISSMGYGIGRSSDFLCSFHKAQGL